MKSPMPTPQVPPGPYMRLRWSYVSLGLAVVTAGAVTTLVIVAKKTTADALSTTALGIAVVAFAAQLIIALAQGISAAQQTAEVSALNADTQAALADLRAANGEVIHSVRGTVATLMAEVIARSRREAEIVDDQSTEDAELAGATVSIAESPGLAALIRATRPLGAEATVTEAFAPLPPSPSFALMTTFPSEAEGRVIAERVRTLTPWEMGRLERFAAGALARSRRGGSTGAWLQLSGGILPTTRRLADKGLLLLNESRLRSEADESSTCWADLTIDGMKVVSLTHGNGPAPDWLLDEMTRSR